MPYYEFTVQIYEDEETAKKVHGNIKSMERSIDVNVGVLWYIDRKVIR